MKGATPQQMQTAWLTGMQTKGANWQKGCATKGANISQNALAQAAKAQANYTRSVQPGGSWNNAMQAGVLTQWRSGCADAGSLARFQAPKQKSIAAYLKFANNAVPIYAAMKQAANAQTTPQTKVVAALNVLIAAGKKAGGTALSGK